MQKCIYDSYLEMYYKLTSSYLFTDPSIFKHMTKTKCNPAPTCKSRQMTRWMLHLFERDGSDGKLSWSKENKA